MRMSEPGFGWIKKIMWKEIFLILIIFPNHGSDDWFVAQLDQSNRLLSAAADVSSSLTGPTMDEKLNG